MMMVMNGDDGGTVGQIWSKQTKKTKEVEKKTKRSA